MAGKKIRNRIKPKKGGIVGIELGIGLVLLGVLVVVAFVVTYAAILSRDWFLCLPLPLLVFLTLPFGIYFIWSATQGFRAMRALMDPSASAVTIGKVLERYTKTRRMWGEENWGQYEYTDYAVVQFDAGERQVNLRVKLDGALYGQIHQGRSLKIRYAKSNPRFALLAGEFRGPQAEYRRLHQEGSLVRQPDLARELGVKSPTVGRWCKKLRLEPAYRVGSNYYTLVQADLIRRYGIAGTSERREILEELKDRPSDCTACGAWNLPGSEYCDECGASLESVEV